MEAANSALGSLHEMASARAATPPATIPRPECNGSLSAAVAAAAAAAATVTIPSQCAAAPRSPLSTLDRSRMVTTEACEARPATPATLGLLAGNGAHSAGSKRPRSAGEDAPSTSPSPQEQQQQQQQLVEQLVAPTERQTSPHALDTQHTQQTEGQGPQQDDGPSNGSTDQQQTKRRKAGHAAEANGSCRSNGFSRHPGHHDSHHHYRAHGAEQQENGGTGSSSLPDMAERRMRPESAHQGVAARQAQPRLSFEDEEQEGDGAAPSMPASNGGGMSAATANRFQAEAHQRRHTFRAGRHPAGPSGDGGGGGMGGRRAAGGCSLVVEDDSELPSAPAAAAAGPQCGLCFGAAQARGLRPYMEDRHCVVAVLTPHSGDTQGAAGGGAAADDGVARSFVAIFDGHNGAGAAEIAASRLHVFLAQEAALRVHTGEPGPPAAALQEEAAVRDALRRSFRRVDDIILGVARQQGVRDGATALVCVRLGGALYAAHAGDSRAVLCRDGSSFRLTEDHKPNLPAEKARINAAGGRVDFQRCWRVVVDPRDGRPGSGLAVSRSLGDLDFKEPSRFVECDPDVSRLMLRPGDWFVVLASDGLWDVMSDEDAVAIASASLRSQAGPDGQAPHSDSAAKVAAEALLAESLRRGTMDNVTVVLMLFSWGSDKSAHKTAT